MPRRNAKPQPYRPASRSPTIDCAEAWDRLPPEIQRQFGIAAIVHGIGALGHDTSPTHPAAEYAGSQVLAGLTLEHVIASDVLPRPDLAVIGVRMCRSCGCTDEVGCPEGCAWVEVDLCSVCAAHGVRRGAVPA